MVQVESLAKSPADTSNEAASESSDINSLHDAITGENVEADSSGVHPLFQLFSGGLFSNNHDYRKSGACFVFVMPDHFH